MLIKPIQDNAVGYDIIGDIHGCADALKELLFKLGYKELDGCYRFVGLERGGPEAKRKVIFVGDLIDRGPQILETLALVKAMVDHDEAFIVLGNHEFNALAYHTPVDDGFLRARNDRAAKQIKPTLDAFVGKPALWAEYLQWFQSMPLFLEFDDFRVVHACWDQVRINAYHHHFGTHCLTREAVKDCAEHTSIAALAVERLTRGISLKLPEGRTITGRDGFKRHSFRVCFWAQSYETYDDVVFQPDPLPEDIRHQPINAAEHGRLCHYDANEKPLFVGHYWLRGKPAIVSSNVACLDYSAVNQGKLVAYRLDTDKPALDNDNFVYVDLAPN